VVIKGAAEVKMRGWIGWGEVERGKTWIVFEEQAFQGVWQWRGVDSKWRAAGR